MTAPRDGLARYRPAREYLLPGNAAWLPGWAAAAIDSRVDLARLRAAVDDRSVVEVLLAIQRIAAVHRAEAAGSAAGTGPGSGVGSIGASEPSEEGRLLGVGECARLVGITDRAVRGAIARDRLPARTVGGRWVVTVADAERFRERRRRRV